MLLNFSSLCSAEVVSYQNTDNTGINKKEQIDKIEKFLSDLSSQFNTLETKIIKNENQLKILETNILALKESISKKESDVESKTVKKKDSEVDKKNEAEIELLKADILAIKNNDIENIRLDVSGLKFSVKNIEKILKISNK
jgi:chromosome segregation ATPase